LESVEPDQNSTKHQNTKTHANPRPPTSTTTAYYLTPNPTILLYGKKPTQPDLSYNYYNYYNYYYYYYYNYNYNYYFVQTTTEPVRDQSLSLSSSPPPHPLQKGLQSNQIKSINQIIRPSFFLFPSPQSAAPETFCFYFYF
jgi:hypothetical protein